MPGYVNTSGGMEPEIVAQHEHDPGKEGEIVTHHGGEDVPGAEVGGGQGEEPDGDDGGVLHQAEGVVQQVFVPRLLLLGIKEHKDIDNT